ncbi:MAG: NAD(P)H-dependent oxidoreductase subunit E [Pseudomonadota bacterium]
MQTESTTAANTQDFAILDELYDKFKDKNSLMIFLQQVQVKFGYVPEYAVGYLSEKLNLSESHIFGVLTFYSQFRTTPVGKNLVKVCMGTACHVAGAKVLGESLKSYLKLDETKDTTEDGLFTIQDVACLGCCALAPAVMVNNKVFGKLDSNSVKKVIDDYRNASQ